MTAWAGRFTPQARVAVQTSTRTPPTKFKTHGTAIQIHTIQSIKFFHFTAKPLKGSFYNLKWHWYGKRENKWNGFKLLYFLFDFRFQAWNSFSSLIFLLVRSVKNICRLYRDQPSLNIRSTTCRSLRTMPDTQTKNFAMHGIRFRRGQWYFTGVMNGDAIGQQHPELPVGGLCRVVLQLLDNGATD